LERNLKIGLLKPILGKIAGKSLGILRESSKMERFVGLGMKL
jgi:hypothetical protein